MTPGLLWPLDLMASAAAQAALLAGGIAAAALLLRRWIAGGLAGVACLVLVGSVTLGRVWEVPPHAVGDGQPIRVLILNARADNHDGGGVVEVVRSADADVIACIEPPGALLDHLRAERDAGRLHAHIPPRAAGGFAVIATRWPHRGIEHPDERTTPRGPGGSRMLVLETPKGGPVAVALMHPGSPRSPSRWAAGNTSLRAALERVTAPPTGGLPLVVCTDLNGGIASHRGRMLRGAGLMPAKPVRRVAGTWPAGWPWPVQVAIDDVWVSGGWLVGSWERVAVPGSDHSGVVVTLVLPASSRGSGR